MKKINPQILKKKIKKLKLKEIIENSIILKFSIRLF